MKKTRQTTTVFNYFVTAHPEGTGLFSEQRREKQQEKATRQSWAEDEEIFLSQATISLLSSALPASLSQPRAGTGAAVIQEMAHGNEPLALLIAEHHFSDKVSPSSFQGDFCRG